MTLDEMRECVLDGIPFVVFGEAMRFSSAETGWTDPHAWYRHHISQGRIAVEVESESEHNALLSKAIAELATLKEENARLKAAWKAEAMAARRVLGSAEWNDADFVAYMATRVKDGE